ncbi:MAG: DUF839 domain-containing protein [Aureispira sp.]|nr:DUF839 domain-containing protein [Aureispira sp.]
MKKQDRRSFLQFLGRTGILVGTSGVLGALSSCNENSNNTTPPTTDSTSTSLPKMDFPLKAIQATMEDDIILSEGLQYQVIVRWGDSISEADQFGFNNDYLAFIPLKDNPNEGLLWSNHEYIQELFISGFTEDDRSKKTKEQVEKEMYAVGGSIIHIKNNNGTWELVQDNELNRRITAKTMIPFDWDEPIAGATEAMGTLAGCAGGVTPWGTVLSCEENYDMFYGETDHTSPVETVHENSYYGWEKHYPQNKPEHYGWVVEVKLETGEAKKLVALGRCAHECATVFELPDKRLVVYTGDDKNDEHLYKFISSEPGSLRNGTLYVANTEKGEWVSLKYEEQEILQKNFKNQTEVLIRLREAAKLLGATPLNRPEDIEIDPETGNVLVALTNNKPKGDYLGQILKIEETNNDKTSLTFKASTFLAGGPEHGFACPDNLAFDQKGNLWFTSDISGSSIGKNQYEAYGNNGLFLVPMSGDQAGEVIQVGSAPKDAEFTGPYFSPDGKTLFLSVQHPGEQSKSLDALTSTWPDGEGNNPKPSVVAISGEALTKLMDLG